MSDKIFDLEEVYDKEIAPLMTKIIEVCKAHNMPMVASFNYACPNENDEEMCTTLIIPPERGEQRTLRAVKRALFSKSPEMYRVTEKNADGQVIAQTLIADLTGDTK
jgi:hypothetical protein